MTDVDESRPWPLIRAALPCCEADAISFGELWLRCWGAPARVEAGLAELRLRRPDGRLRRVPHPDRYWFEWHRRP